MGGETMNFINGAELLEYCEKENKKISEAMFERETTFLEQDPENKGENEESMVHHAGVGEEAVKGKYRQHGRHDRRGEQKAPHAEGK